MKHREEKLTASDVIWFVFAVVLTLFLFTRNAKADDFGFLFQGNASSSPAVTDVSKSAVLLYRESYDGSKMFRCTATSIRSNNLFHSGKFLTAAHCVVTDDPKHEGNLKAIEEGLFLSPDQGGDSHSYTRAKVAKLGDMDEGLDYAILDSSLDVPPVPMGAGLALAPGDSVLTWNGGAGLDIMMIQGTVARAVIDRPLINLESHINWRGDILVQAPAIGGASGSALTRDGRIVGVVVAGNGELMIAVPIARVLADLAKPKETSKPEDEKKK